MLFEVQEICQLVETIWSAVLGCEVQRGPATNSPRIAGALTGLVPITGAWEGAVVLECPAGFARQAAGIMFEIEPELVTTDQIQDTLGELTNIVGGNFKSLLPGACHLGLPAVAEGGDYALRIPGSRVLTSLTFQTSDFPFVVTILVREPSGADTSISLEPAQAG